MDLVLSCVTHDRRWDRQTEERSTYLARLVRALKVPLEPIRSHISNPDLWEDTVHWDLSLPLEVLHDLARIGHPDAADALCEFIATAHGPIWMETIETLWEDSADDVRRRLHDVVFPRLTDQDITRWAEPKVGVWEAWRTSDARIDDALQHAQAPPVVRPSVPDLTTLPGDELARRVTSARAPERREAWRELGARQDLQLLDLAELPATRNHFGAVPGLSRALLALGPAALPRARAWLTGPDTLLHPFASDVLAAHGQPRDAPALLTTFLSACNDDNWYLTETCADGLGRLRHRPAVDALRAAWEHTLHSHARVTFLTALLTITSEDADELTDEGLHDCETQVRALAAHRCTVTAQNRSHLGQLGADNLEDADVRAELVRRLAGPPPNGRRVLPAS